MACKTSRAQASQSIRDGFKAPSHTPPSEAASGLSTHGSRAARRPERGDRTSGALRRSCRPQTEVAYPTVVCITTPGSPSAPAAHLPLPPIKARLTVAPSGSGPVYWERSMSECPRIPAFTPLDQLAAADTRNRARRNEWRQQPAASLMRLTCVNTGPEVGEEASERAGSSTSPPARLLSHRGTGGTLDARRGLCACLPLAGTLWVRVRDPRLRTELVRECHPRPLRATTRPRRKACKQGSTVVAGSTR